MADNRAMLRALRLAKAGLKAARKASVGLPPMSANEEKEPLRFLKPFESITLSEPPASSGSTCHRCGWTLHRVTLGEHAFECGEQWDGRMQQAADEFTVRDCAEMLGWPPAIAVPESIWLRLRGYFMADQRKLRFGASIAERWSYDVLALVGPWGLIALVRSDGDGVAAIAP